MTRQRIIDVHNHFYPPEYIEALRSKKSVVKVTMDKEGNPHIHYPGDYNVAVAGHRDIAYRQGVLEREGVDTQVITITTPGTHVEKAAYAAKLASLCNDAFARIIAERGPRFAALATLPLNSPKSSVKELTRAHEQLKLPGAMLFSNVNGVALADERFWPIYEYADAKSLVLHIHPTSPVGVEAMTKYWLMPLVGFLMDTTLAAAHLVFSGVPERFPRIKRTSGCRRPVGAANLCAWLSPPRTPVSSAPSAWAAPPRWWWERSSAHRSSCSRRSSRARWAPLAASCWCGRAPAC